MKRNKENLGLSQYEVCGGNLPAEVGATNSGKNQTPDGPKVKKLSGGEGRKAASHFSGNFVIC